MTEPPTINGRTPDTETELSIRGQTGRYKYRWMTGQDITRYAACGYGTTQPN